MSFENNTELYSRFEKERDKKAEETLGPKKMRVAVLGAFDTWSLMHNIAVELARQGYTAVTSRYTYNCSDHTELGYYRVKQPEDPDLSLNDFLKKKVIGNSKKAIIVYTVPAAHYNEADWCMQENSFRTKYGETFETLGIAFVRKISGEGFCPDYGVNNELGYGYCNGVQNAWYCIEQGNCPFINQQIAKNQLEYFTSEAKETMKLICIEKIENIDQIIHLHLTGELQLPSPKPYVFEFRIELNEMQKEELINNLNILTLTYEDEVITEYKYEDTYYKPKNTDIEKWIAGNKTIRIRNYPKRILEKVEVIQSEIDRTSEGFFTKYPFGNKQVWEDDFESVEKNFLADMSLEYFFYVKKDEGLLYKIRTPFDTNIYIEKLIFEDNENSNENIWNAEIEFWMERIENKELAHTKKQIILKQINIDCKDTIKEPIQQHYWIKIKK